MTVANVERTMADRGISSLDYPMVIPQRVSSATVGTGVEDSQFVVRITALDHAKWVHATVEALIKLLYLSEGWDSYGAKQVQGSAMNRMTQILASVLEPDSPAPTIVPTSQGGVQAEWHRNQIDLEIEVTGTGEVSFYFKSPTEEKEGTVAQDQAALRLRKYTRAIGNKNQR